MYYERQIGKEMAALCFRMELNASGSNILDFYRFETRLE
jgi:hypothetical protein